MTDSGVGNDSLTICQAHAVGGTGLDTGLHNLG